MEMMENQKVLQCRILYLIKFILLIKKYRQSLIVIIKQYEQYFFFYKQNCFVWSSSSNVQFGDFFI